MTIPSARMRCFVALCATFAACGGDEGANTDAALNGSGHASAAGDGRAVGTQVAGSKARATSTGTSTSASGAAAGSGGPGSASMRGTTTRAMTSAASSGMSADAAMAPASGAAPADASVGTGTPTAATPAAPAGWKLVWNDEFDGTKGTKLDPSRWVYETGGSGWGNNQLEYDTDRAENASLDGNGELTISAIKESYMGKSYSSVRLNTQGKFEHQYGRYEARMRLPFGQGIWPAFWMLGVDTNNVGWPTRGEIDIMENIGREPDTIHGTLHGPGYSGGNGIGAPSKLAMGQRFADDYHVFAIEWEQNVVRWYADGKLYQTRTPADLPKGSKWVYDHPFFLLLNLAVGGQWPGNPDASTTFPQTMQVDYVRVYEREN
jgi:beta-glucanase (GH16 family)